MADRRYETLVLIHPDQGEPGAKELATRIRTLVEEQGGAVTQAQEWGLRDLAHTIGKQRRAFYILFEYRVASKGLDEIQRTLKLMDPVLRFVSVRPRELPERTREDHSGADHGHVRPPSAAADGGDQAGPDRGPAAVHERVSVRRRRLGCPSR